MKRWLGSLLPALIVALAFIGASHVHPFGWRWAALSGAFFLLSVFYVQRYPRVVALEYALKLKPGQKVEVEGK